MKVIVTCQQATEYLETEEVEFLNIEEDMQGRDVMTFKCPLCGEIHKSLVFGK